MKDDKDLMGSVAKALIDGGREADDPSEADRARNRARLAAALGVTALSAVTSKAAAAAALAEGAAATGLAAANSGAGAAASSAAGGVALGATAGAAAGTAAVSGGLWAALTAKSVASVVAAAALGAAVTTAVVVVEREDPAAMREREAVEAASAPSRRDSTARPQTREARPQPTLQAQPALASNATAPAPVMPREPATAANPRNALRGEALAIGPRGATHALPPRTFDSTKAAAGVPSLSASRAGVASGDAAKAAITRGESTPSRGSTVAAARSPATLQPAPVAPSEPVPPATSTPASAVSIDAPAHAATAAANSSAAQLAESLAPAATNSVAMLDDSLGTAAARTPNATQPARPAALSGEIQLLASVQHAIRDNQLPRALTLLNEHATRYPTGTLRPEQLAARAVVLCRMGETNPGRIALQKLQAETPSSPLLRWARETCGL